MKLKIVLILSFFAAVSFDGIVNAESLADFGFKDNDYNYNDYDYDYANNPDVDNTFSDNCPFIPDNVINGHIWCIRGDCRVTCDRDHRFPNGETELAIVCLDNGIWKVLGDNYYNSFPRCEPVCLPECKNNGICIKPNECNCPENFSGPQCQFDNTPCLNEPPKVKNAETSHGTMSSTITCHKGFAFPDGTTVTNVICKHGNWEPTRNDLESIPDCEIPIDQGGIKNKPGVCFIWTDKHFKTFDGHVFSFDSDCAYTLLKDTRDGLFSIVVQNDPLCQQNATCPRILRLFVQDKEYDLAANPVTRFPELRNGKKIVSVPSQLSDLRVEAETGQFLVVSLDILGLKIKWDGEKIVEIEASESSWNRTAGLCGNFNGDRFDDYNSAAKTPLHAVSVWKIDDIGEKCEEHQNKQNPCDRDANVDREAGEFCTNLLSDSRYSSCLNQVDFAGFHAACKWDYCSCKKADPQKCACDTMAVYTRQCVHKGLATTWRDNNICPMECTNGRIYMDCGPRTQQSCGVNFSNSPMEEKTDMIQCQEGCFCPTGMVLHEGRCIQPTECPCRLRGKSFEAGAQVSKDCNNCTCQAGQWNCTEIKCSARCSAIGDPHYTTFDGKRYDFMGTCSYYLVRGDDYSIEAENSPCTNSISQMMGFTRSYKDGDPSCTKTVTIRMNNVAIKLNQNHQILINGEEATNLPIRTKILTDEIRVRILSSIFIAVELPNGLQVLWDGVSRVYVNAPPQFRGHTMGLCGKFNANQKDDFFTPDGDVEKAVVPFANKWKTNERCADIIGNPINPCDVNPHKRDAAEKFCSVLKKKLFLDCHWNVDPEPFYKDCLYDMCSCESNMENCLCPTLAAYAKDCAHSGVIIPWRQEVKECRVHCPGDQEYQVCGSSCKRSCADISFHLECKEECVEGCNCPENQTLDVNGNCIPINQCPCIKDGLEFPAGYKEIRPGTKSQELCTCAGGVWNCQAATPNDMSKYPSTTELKTLCSATKHQELTTCEPVERLTCNNMHRHISQSPAICRPGCVCKAGYVLDVPTGECVPENQCPCYHGGRSYKEGDFRQKECNTCRCTQGKWNCTDTPCPGVCSVWGDSHYNTFDDKLFSFQGACEYVLAKGKLNDDEAFDVTVRNVPCGTTGVTCSKSITLTIGKNSHAPEEKITLTRGKSLAVGDFKNLQRIAVRRAGLFVFFDIPDLGLVLQWDEGTRVYVRLDSKWKGHTKGLCGDFNDNAEDDFKTPSGGLSEASASIFGDSWKLSELCAEPDEKQPDTCAQRPERRMWATQKCRIMKSSVFEACHSEISPDEYIEKCIYDACACDEGGDCECLCTAIAAYAQECNAMGVPIHWRSQKLCPMQCDETYTKYSSCISTCPRETCDNLVTLGDSLHLCDQDTCVEGCKPKVCPEGHIYLNSSYSECVPRASCKPVCAVINGVIYYEGDKIKGDDCHSCFCSRGKEVCKGLPCDYGKCKSGWTSWWNKDRPKDNGFRNEIEKIPSLTELLNSGSSAYCDKDMIDNIKCRQANTTLSHKEIGLYVDCSMDTGFTCQLSDNPGKNCPDFEISVYCQCKNDQPRTPSTPWTPPSEACETNIYRSNPSNCFEYFHCEVGPSGYNKWIAKTCPPSVMFNDKINDCDWLANVRVVRPECRYVNDPPTTDPSCRPGEHWNKCAIRCSRTCQSYNNLLTTSNKCNRTIDCIPGCVSDVQMECKGNDNYWLNENTCVHRSDCTCMSDDGQIVSPGQVVRESDCKICQCLNNHYTCNEDNCTKTNGTDVCIFKPPTIYDFPGVLLLPHVNSPPRDCPRENYMWISDQSISASSYLIADDTMPLQRNTVAFVWQPSIEDEQPWLQLELPEPQPIYGIVVGGDPYENAFVTSYHVLYSDDGHLFSVVGPDTENPTKFRGPVESNKLVEQLFDSPVEAKFIRVYPINCHNTISMHIELIVCGERTYTTATPPVTPPIPPIVCKDPMGYDSGLMDRHQIKVSSTYNGKEPNLRISHTDTWHPILDNPDQYVQFNFSEPRILTGVETKGGDGTWVTQYTVKYSQDGRDWSPIIDVYGFDKKFLANYDDFSSHINYFDMPVDAKFLRIHPYTWHKHIGMRVEIRGCYYPYPPTIPPTTETPPAIPCNNCPNIEFDGQCRCNESFWWDGLKCVPKQNCPCFVDGITYQVGSTYHTSNCEICTCAMNGWSSCSPLKCPACENRNQRSVVDQSCECRCKNCPNGQRLCPTNDVCIDEKKWCNGIKDCPDDESDECEFIIFGGRNETNTTITTSGCMTTCPDGYVLVDNIRNGFNYVNSSVTKVHIKTYHSTTVTKIRVPAPQSIKRSGALEQAQICPKFKCTKIKHEGNCDNDFKCPEGMQSVYDPTKSIRKNKECDNSCVPIPAKKRVCSVIGRSFTTFDGTTYKYDLCSHVLARDMDANKWFVIAEKVCDERGWCQKVLSVTYDEHEVILQQNMYVTIDGIPYNPIEAKCLGDTNPAMKISRIGNALRFESENYPFWALLDVSGTMKIGVSEELTKHVDGMCGYLDGIACNDQQTPQRTLARSSHEFGESWKTLDSTECILQQCKPEVRKETWKIVTYLHDPIFEACAKVLNRDQFMSSFMESHCACMTNGNSTAQQCGCDALSTYVSECLALNGNIDLSNWRAIYDCPIMCEAPFVPKDCFRPKCETSCSNLLEPDACSNDDDTCVQGCFCPDGMVRHGDTCIPPAQCRDCVCDGLGHSRYISFDRSNVFFDGNCTYLLSRDVTQSSDFMHKYQIFVTNVKCELGICTEAITVFYDNHVVQIKKTDEPNRLMASVDDQQVIYYPFEIPWLTIEMTSNRDVQLLIPEIQLEIVAFKQNLAFVLRLPSQTFGGAMEGLCGNCNGKQYDDLKKYDGKFTNDQQEFGNSWAANNLPDTVNLNFHDEQCSYKPSGPCIPEEPPTNGICEQLLMNVTFARCHSLVNPLPYYFACKNTLCQDACPNFEAYARMCSMAGLCIDWRTPQFCPYECTDNLEYQACGTSCLETCQSIENPMACTKYPVEGCFCPVDHFWQNGICVPKGNCYPCDAEGHVDGDVWYSKDFCVKNTCERKNGSLLVTSVNETCETINPTDEIDYEIELIPIPGECCPKIVRTACQTDEFVYGPGNFWISTDGCIRDLCVETDNGQIVKNRKYTTCNMDCGMGWEYQEPKDSETCCGVCKQVYCNVDDHLYKPGETWSSDDNCTTYSCTENDGQIITSISPKHCPKINCDPKFITFDGCCQTCNNTGYSDKNCETIVYNVADTVGLITEIKEDHGFCENLEPIDGLAQCSGHCNSSTHFDKSWDHVIDCSCCQPTDYKKISVTLTCRDYYMFERTLTVPTTCSCEACSGGSKQHSIDDTSQEFWVKQ